MYRNDTICAPATAVSGGAIAVIRLSGPEALEIAGKVVTLKSGSIEKARPGTIRYGDIPGTDDVLVSVFRAPHSYTGEDSVEISCHCSAFIVKSILGLLVSAGARMAEPGEFTRRAYLAGKMDLAQAEAVSDVITASSEAAHRVALNQLRGHYSDELRSLRDAILELTALVELELDFSEEEVEFANRDRLAGMLLKARERVDALAESFRVGNAIKNGVPVAIAGAVNSGKSTLLNALTGEERAIVSDIPGTTRDTVEEVVTIGGVQFRFIDTAGIRETTDKIERIGIDRSFAAIARAEIVIGVIDTVGCDGTLLPTRSIEDAAEELRKAVPEGTTLILALNKADLIAGRTGTAQAPVDGAVLISAKTGLGLDALRERLAGYTAAAAEGTVVTSARHHAALCKASESLRAVSSGMDAGIPTDLLAEDLREAVRALGRIWGEDLGITSQDTLNRIFERFCIGK